MLLIPPNRAPRNLSFDELSYLYAVNFERQPDQQTTSILLDKDGCAIHDSESMLSLDWLTGELRMNAIDNVRAAYIQQPQAIEGLARPLTISKKNKIRDQLAAFNVAFI